MMICKECDYCKLGFFPSRPDAYVCTGVKNPYIIDDIYSKCGEQYGETRTNVSDTSMTCREKLINDNPDFDKKKIDEVIDKTCPDDYGYVSKPEYCGKAIDSRTCIRCWNRVIVEEKENYTLHPDVTIDNRCVIKDSGDRTQFESGAVRDMHAGKGRMDLLPWAAIMEVSKHCENGANKYGEHNVDRGIPTSSLCDSAARHLAKYLDGWEDEPHLVAAAWNLLWAIQMVVKNKDMVNTPWRGDMYNNK